VKRERRKPRIDPVLELYYQATLDINLLKHKLYYAISEVNEKLKVKSRKLPLDEDFMMDVTWEFLESVTNDPRVQIATVAISKEAEKLEAAARR